MAWVYIGVILCMRVVQSVFNKRAAVSIPKRADLYVRHSAYRQIVAFLLAAAFLLIESLVRHTSVERIGATVAYASLSGVCLSLSLLCGLYAIRHSTLALTSFFGTAGLLVPTVISAVFYEERFGVWQIIAFAALLASVWLLVGGDKRRRPVSWKTLLALLAISLLEGGTMLAQKLFGMNVSNGNVSAFTAMQFLIAAVLSAFALLFFPKRPKDTIEQLPPRSYLYGFFLAAAVFVISQLATLTTPLLPAVLLFAIINGGATLIAALVDTVLYGEKLTCQGILGLLLGIGALIMMKG